VSAAPPKEHERKDGFIDKHLPKIIAVLLSIATIFSGVVSNRSDLLEEQANEMKIAIDTLERTAKAEETAARQYASSIDSYENQVVLLGIENGNIETLKKGYETDIGGITTRYNEELEQVNQSYVTKLANETETLAKIEKMAETAKKQVSTQTQKVKKTVEDLLGVGAGGGRGAVKETLGEPVTMEAFLKVTREENVLDEYKDKQIDLRQETIRKREEIRELEDEQRYSLREVERERDAEIMEKRIQQKRLDDDITMNNAQIAEINKLINKYQGMDVESTQKSEASYTQTNEKVQEVEGLREKADRLMRVPIILNLALFLFGFAGNSDKKFFKIVFTIIGILALGFSGFYFLRIMRVPV
jgi:DNA repair exonuclease SbcCD ATPase subunit